jgi:hypothetical protein
MARPARTTALNPLDASGTPSFVVTVFVRYPRKIHKGEDDLCDDDDPGSYRKDGRRVSSDGPGIH